MTSFNSRAYTTRIMQRNPMLSPTPAVVDVWLATPTARDHFDACTLTQTQRATWSSLRTERRRRDFEVSRSLLVAIGPQTSWDRSLSHSNGYAAVATAERGTVGIDIEVCVPRNGPRLADGAFTADEARFVTSQPEDTDRNLAFYELWVLKEACAKALGIPLTAILRGTNFATVLAGTTASFGNEFGATAWSAWVYAPRPDVRMAVFCSGAGRVAEPRAHEWPGTAATSWPLVHRLPQARALCHMDPA